MATYSKNPQPVPPGAILPTEPLLPAAEPVVIPVATAIGVGGVGVGFARGEGIPPIAGGGVITGAQRLKKGDKITENSKQAIVVIYDPATGSGTEYICEDADVLADLATAKKWNQDYGDTIIITTDSKARITKAEHETKVK